MSSEANNPTPDPAPTPLRAASALDIARKLGCNKRTLQRWAEQGCPHTLGTRKGRPSPSFDFSEVLAWMRTQGLDGKYRGEGGERRSDGGGGGEEGSGKVAKWQSGTVKGATQGGVPHGEDVGGEESEADLWSMTFRAPAGDLDLMGPLQRLLESVDKAIGQLTKGATPAELQKIGSAMSDISTQFRAIRQAEFEHQKRMGAFVPLADARRVIGEHANAFVFDLQQLGADVPVKVAAALVEAGLLSADGDVVGKARRVMVPVVNDAIGRARDRRAGASAAAMDAVGRAVA